MYNRASPETAAMMTRARDPFGLTKTPPQAGINSYLASLDWNLSEYRKSAKIDALRGCKDEILEAHRQAASAAVIRRRQGYVGQGSERLALSKR